MADVELRMVEELTEVQAEIADWYMGSTAVQEWFNNDFDHPEGCDFSDLPRPKLENQKFAFPNDADVLDDFIYRVTEQYIQMAMDAAEIDTVQGMIGKERAAKNLVEKVKEALDDDVVQAAVGENQ